MHPKVVSKVDVAYSGTLNEEKTEDTPTHPSSPTMGQPEIGLESDHVGALDSTCSSINIDLKTTSIVRSIICIDDGIHGLKCEHHFHRFINWNYHVVLVIASV